MANVNEIRQLVKKRGTLKAQITSFKTFLSRYDGGNAIDCARITTRLNKFKETFANVDTIFDKLDELDDENDHTAERIYIQEEYLDLISDAEKLMSMIPRPISISDRESEHAVVNNIDGTGELSQSNTFRLKLPEASLPKFDGRYEQWLSFKDSFLAMIGNRRELSNVIKLQYLKACLTGDAARKLNIFNISEENYARAWDVLQQSYQDERLIITRHLSLLINLPIQNKESAMGLTRLADETQQHVMSLQSLGVDVGEHIVVQLLVEKLHKPTRQKWEESLQRNVFPKLSQLMEFLYATSSRLAQWEREERDGNRSSQKAKSNDSSRAARSTKTLVTTAAAKCSVCAGESHPLYKCEKFRELSVPARMKIVNDASLCLNCLRSHGTKECKFRSCSQCNERHNTLLHKEKAADSAEIKN